MNTEPRQETPGLQGSRRKRQAVPGLAPVSSDPFIVATDRKSLRPDSKSRDIIRSHVMRGKNLKRVTSIGSWINDRNGSLATQILAPKNLALRDSPDNPVTCSDTPWSGLSPHLHPMVQANPELPRLIHEFIAVMRNAMFPVESVASCLDLSLEEQYWLEDLSHDPSYVRTILYSAQVFFGAIQKEPFGPKVAQHINDTIVLLQKKLAEDSPTITDSLICTVLALAMLAEVLGDLETVKKHLHGMYGMIKVRYGITTLSHKYSLQVKCCRLDLRYALKTGSKPLFFADDSLSWNSYLGDHRKASSPTPIDALHHLVDDRLINVWLDLRELTTAMNLSHQTKRKLSPRLYQEALISIHYRLQHLEYPDNSLQEILRIFMLTFSATIYFDIQSGPLQYQNLSAQVRNALKDMDQGDTSETPRLTLWLIFVARTAECTQAEDLSWLRELFQDASGRLKLADWEETRSILKSYIWVNEVHDRRGQSFYNELCL